MRPYNKNQKALYKCFECPERSLECFFDDLLVRVYVSKCSDKCYRYNPESSNGICYACPPNSLTCEMMEDKIVPKLCEDTYYMKQTGENAWDLSCLQCPDRALSCTYDKSSGKVSIPEDGCEPDYFVEKAEQQDKCVKCPDELGCTQCNSLTTCKKSDKSLCKTGFYESNNACLKCDKSCVGCESNSTNCTSCQKIEYVKEGKCISCSGTFP